MSQTEKMIDAMVAETMAKGVKNKENGNLLVETIYFGGGTPSLLSNQQLNKLLEAVNNHFKVLPSAEITLESNPDDISVKSLDNWKMCGINRLSIGVQSFIEKDLRWMNRVHTVSQSINSIMDAKKAGFDNFSVDLIFGIPTLSNDDWKKNVYRLVDLAVPHIAAYALTVEPATALQKMIFLNKKENVDHAKQASQFLLIMEWLEESGYQHYEISNFCKPGKKSRHNSSYWNGIPYIGIGPSAHSFDGVKRSWNISNNALYMNMEKNIIPYEEETLTPIQQLNEYIMTSLRTMEGLKIDHINNTFGKNYADTLDHLSIKFENRNHIIRQNNILILTNEGKLFADGIASELFFSQG